MKAAKLSSTIFALLLLGSSLGAEESASRGQDLYISPALKSIDFDIKPGEVVAFLGPSGAGKTTLINILTGYTIPTKGKYSIFGKDLDDLTAAEREQLLGRAIGYIPYPLDLDPEQSIKQIVGDPLLKLDIPADEAEKMVLDALRLVNLTARSDARPDQLSGGQQQRVGIARAIVHKPALLIADEPTGNLDPKASDEVLALLRDLQNDNMTSIYISHDLGIAERADRLILLSTKSDVGKHK